MQRKNNFNLSELIQEIQAFSDDIRAEIIVNELIQNKILTQDEVVISNEGQFSRAYRFDILNAKIQDDNFESQEYLKIGLSRDSIYDTLPEGFVHNLSEENGEKSVRQMIKERKHQKKQEVEARNFFNPFENEIFHYRTKIENVERDFLYKLNGSQPLSFFYDFWGLSSDFPPILVSKLIQILPYAYKIVGNIDLSCQCLSSIIQEPVSFRSFGSKEYSDENEAINLGENRLGVDFICGNNYMDYSLNVKIEIGPIAKSPFHKFIHDGDIKKFIDCFYEHFFPMEVEIKTVLLMHQETEAFHFNQQPVLGYTTRI